MVGQVIAVANQKGGVGKTTLGVHLAAFLSREGKRVIIVDGDPQGNATSWLLNGEASESGLFGMAVARQPWRDCVQMVNGAWQVGLVPGGPETGDAMVVLAALRKPFDTLARAIRPMGEVADFVLIDMPPSKAAGFRELLYAADWVLVPTQLERFGLEGVVLMAQTCTALREEQGRGPRLLGVVPNMVRPRTVEHQRQLRELVGAFGKTVWPPIAQSVRVSEVSSRGTTLYDYAPKEAATAAMVEVGRRVVLNVGAARSGDRL